MDPRGSERRLLACARGNRESLAFAIVSAESLGMPLQRLASALQYTRDDLRDRNVLDLAERMRAELDDGPSGVRVPIVVTDEELDHMPLLTTYQTLDMKEVAAVARDVVMRGAAEAAAWRDGIGNSGTSRTV